MYVLCINIVHKSGDMYAVIFITIVFILMLCVERITQMDVFKNKKKFRITERQRSDSRFHSEVMITNTCDMDSNYLYPWNLM